MKPEHLSLSAIALTVLLGGGGLGLNYQSNAGVTKELKELRDASIQVNDTLKTIDKTFERADKRFDKLESMVESLRAENSDLKQKIALLEVKHAK